MGYVIVIEGTDGCGKQTQSERLANRLISNGYNVKRLSFPNYDSPSAAPVKMYLGGEFGSSDKSLDAYQASVLFAVDRMCTYKKDLEKFYNDGGIIIFDRYVESNMLHQAGKLDNLSEINDYCDWLDQLEFDTLKLPRPNKVIFLDVPVELSMRLAKERGVLKNQTTKDIHEQNPDHLKHAYACGKYMIDKYGWQSITCNTGDKMRTIEDISDEIYSLVIDDIENFTK